MQRFDIFVLGLLFGPNPSFSCSWCIPMHIYIHLWVFSSSSADTFSRSAEDLNWKGCSLPVHPYDFLAFDFHQKNMFFSIAPGWRDSVFPTLNFLPCSPILLFHWKQWEIVLRILWERWSCIMKSVFTSNLYFHPRTIIPFLFNVLKINPSPSSHSWWKQGVEKEF